MAQVQLQGPGLEGMVKDKLDEELAKLTGEGKSGTKAARDAAALILPSLANIITVAVSTAVTTAMNVFVEKMESKVAEMQRYCLLNKFENDKLEQYSRRDNLRISGLEEDVDETEEVLEAKVIELAADIGVKLKPEEISVAHRLGKPRDGGRPLIVRFCHRKKRNEMMSNKKRLKGSQRKVYINEDLTSLRATMFSMVKEQETVKGVSTRDGSISAWLTSGGRPVVVNTPDDLLKVGITSPDWKRLKLEYLF